MTRRLARYGISALFFCFLLVTSGSTRSASAAMDFDQIQKEQKGVDFDMLGRQWPQLKTIVLLGFQHPLQLKDVIALINHGVWPMDSGFLPSLGQPDGVFYTRAQQLKPLRELPFVEKLVPLVTFRMSGLYRIHFKVVEPDFSGPLAFSVATPRNGFGKTLVLMEDHVSPTHAFAIRDDQAGNRWLEATFSDMSTGDTAKFDFYFIYQVNVKKMLEHAIGTVDVKEIAPIPDDHPAAVYLYPSEKIEAFHPVIQEKAGEIFDEQTSPKLMYRHLVRYLKEHVAYDSRKRQEFFGGMKIYRNMSEMYKRATETMAAGIGACPDTSILEVAFLRAAHVPSRTASRWGHIYAEIFVPPRGWVSTSVTPTGIPLSVDTDNRNLPFVSWDQDIAVQTILWDGRVHIDIGEMYE